MPSLNSYKKILGSPKTVGQEHKDKSDMVMNATWYNDLSAKTVWFYDQEHDEEFEVRDNLHPERTHKIPVEVKLFEVEYNSLAKDETAYHLQFKPGYECTIPSYEDKFAKPLKSTFPIGLYFDSADSNGIFHRWLVVGQYRYYSNQFPTFLVLPCDFKLQWIHKGQKLESWGVLRSQSSYNSGIWTD